jgi:hypothetical protein
MLSIYEAGNIHTMVTNNKRQTIPNSPGQLYMSCRVSFSHTQILFISKIIVTFSNISSNEILYINDFNSARFYLPVPSPDKRGWKSLNEHKYL